MTMANGMEVRIYFECLEQAYHYLYPIVQKAVDTISKNAEIKLVKLRGDYKYYSRKVAPIIFWKKPDALITIVQDNVEHPLLLIEFSNAVFTEDHELQRFDGLVAAAKNNCMYAKISPTTKASPSEHGGKIEFDYAGPYSLIQRRYGKTFFHFEWKCDEKGVVEVKKDYVSCPKPIEVFERLVNTILCEALEKGHSNEWVDSVFKNLKKEPFFGQWIRRLKLTPEVDVTSLSTSRTRWLGKDADLGTGALELKLNRFGHAMDPERGMLAYFGSMGKSIISKMLFTEDNDAWYKDIPKEDQIRSYIQQNGLLRAYDFLICFALGSGLHENEDFMNTVKNYEQDASSRIEIDLTDFIRTNFFSLSKPLKTIFGYSALFILEDKNGRRRVIFRWEPYDEPEFFKKYPATTPLKKRTTLEEDDVTYITVHNILRPNGYKIIAVSYPGAQADRVILVEPGTGRRQKRKYIDIISFLPDEITNLQENKGRFSREQIQKDIDEMTKYKRDKNYVKALKTFQKRFAPESLDTVIKIGVGFWSSRTFSLSKLKDLDLRDLDYFVYITNDRKKWSVWSTDTGKMFAKVKGKVSLPQTYDMARRRHSDKSNTLNSFFNRAR